MATVNALSVALFNAAAGGYASELAANPANFANAVGPVLQKDVSTDALFVDHLLSNLGVSSTSAVYSQAKAAVAALVTTKGRAGAASDAIDFLKAQEGSTSAYATIAADFAAKVNKAAAFTAANATERDITKLVSAITGVDTDVLAINTAVAAQKAADDAAAAAAVAKAAADAKAAAEATAKAAADKAAADAAAALKAANDKATADATAAKAAADKAAADAATALKAAQDKAAADLTAANTAAAAAAKTASDAAAKAASDAAAALKAAQDKAATDAATAAAKAAADLKAAQDTITALQNPAGSTGALTTKADVKIGIAGGNDSFTATDATLSTGDIIVDGSTTDNDTLTITGRAFQTAINTTNTTIANIENIVANFDSLANSTFTATGVAGATNVTVNQVRDGSSALITVAGLGDKSVVSAGTGLTGGLTVTMTGADRGVTVNTGTATGTATVTTTGTGSITTTGGAAALSLSSADGDITVTKTGAGAVSATASGKGNVLITANAATGTVSGQSATGNVTVNADAATTATATATAGNAAVSSTGATTLNATGAAITASGVAATAINLTGTSDSTDTAIVSAKGTVTVDNNATNVETITLQGNTASLTATLQTTGADLVLNGSQNVTVKSTTALMTGHSVVDNVVGTTLIDFTTVAASDLSKISADSIKFTGAAGAGTYTFKPGSNVTIAVNPAAGGQTLDISDNTSSNVTGSLNLSLSADTTRTLTLDTNGDAITTLGVATNVAQTALDVRASTTAGKGVINITGTGDVTVAAGATASLLSAAGSSGVLTASTGASMLTIVGGTGADALTLTATAKASVDGGAGNDAITVGGITLLSTNTINGGTGTDTLNLGSSADISAATVSGIEIIAQGSNNITVNADQVNLAGLVFTGTGATTVNNIGSTLSLENLSFSDTGTTVIDASSASNPALGSSAARVITGSSNADTITGADGNDTINGGAGNDTLTGGKGADALSGGLGDNTYVYTAAGQAPSGETIVFNQTSGATETISVTTAAIDLSALNGGALLTGLDAVKIASGLSVTFLPSQVTGLTLAVTGVSGGAAETFTVVGTSSSETINLSKVTLTNAVVSITANAGDDTITGTGGVDTITGGTGADKMTGGAGADVYVIGNSDSGITVATADSIVGFVSGSDQLKLGTAGDVSGAGADTYVEASTAVADFSAALVAANSALAVLHSGSTATELFAFQFDASNGYLFNDVDGDGVADQVIVLVGITNTAIAASDIIA